MAITNKKRQVNEIIKCGKDPVYFLNKYVKIQHPNRGLLAFDTYPFQDDCLESFVDHRFNIVLKSRQLGISTLTAAYAVWLALFYKDKNILIIATKLSIAMNFMKKVKVAIKGLPRWLVLSDIVSNNKQSIEFSNGSQIKAVPTSDDAGRSESLSLLIVDEAAFVRNFDELWMGLYPTISTGGRAIVVSTPNGIGGQYYELYAKAETKENEFNPIKLPWDVHPEHDGVWFEKESRNFSPKQIAQEFLCDFAASGDTFLIADDIENVRQRVRPPLEKWGPDMGVWVWKYPLTEHKYLITADVARGDAQDYSAFHVVDTEMSEVVAEFKGKIPPDSFAMLLNEAGRRYNQALICPENNTYGYATVMKLVELEYPNLYYKNAKDRYAATTSNESKVYKIGFTTSAKSRGQILTKLEEVLRNGSIRTYSSRLYEELKTFVWKGQKAQAQKGKNDDLVIALAIAAWLVDTSGQYSSQSTVLNRQMVEAFSVNKRTWGGSDEIHDPAQRLNPFKPIMVDSSFFSSGSQDCNDNFSWLLN